MVEREEEYKVEREAEYMIEREEEYVGEREWIRLPWHPGIMVSRMETVLPMEWR